MRGSRSVDAPGLRVYSPPDVDRIWGKGGLIIIYPKPYSIYLRGTVGLASLALGSWDCRVEV